MKKIIFSLVLVFLMIGIASAYSQTNLSKALTINNVTGDLSYNGDYEIYATYNGAYSYKHKDYNRFVFRVENIWYLNSVHGSLLSTILFSNIGSLFPPTTPWYNSSGVVNPIVDSFKQNLSIENLTFSVNNVSANEYFKLSNTTNDGLKNSVSGIKKVSLSGDVRNETNCQSSDGCLRITGDFATSKIYVYPNFTITAKFNLTNTGGSGTDTAIISRGTHGSTTLYLIYVNSTNSIGLYIDNTHYGINSTYILTRNVWHNITFSWDGTRSYVLIDNQLTHNVSNDGAGTGGTGGDFLGDYHTTSVPSGNLTFDEVYVYNKPYYDLTYYKNAFTRYLKIPQNTFFTNARMNLSGYQFGTSNLSKLNVSINNKEIFYYPTNFSQTNNKTNNFASILNEYLSTCSLFEGYCIIPINITSNTSGTLQYSDLQFNDFGFVTNNISYNSSVYEMTSQTFILNTSFSENTYTSSSATLYYNGTAYSTTKSGSNNNYLFSTTLNIPTTNSISNATFYWTLALTNSTGISYYNSSIYNQTINPTYFVFCNSTITSRYINFTFHNETTAEEAVKATFDGSFIYSLSSDFATNKTYTYTSAVEQTNYSFCFSPPSQTIYAKANFNYDNAYSQQRTYINNSLVLTNSTFVQDLLLLPDVEGVGIDIIVQNNYYQRIESALISIKRSSDSSLVEQKYTDGTGIAAFFLDSGTNYRVEIDKSGYDAFSTSLTPSTSPVTYTLTTTATSSSGNSGGISISIYPRNNRLENNTQYEFIFDISDSSDDLEEYGFSLWNSTAQLTTEQSDSSADGSELNVNYNIGNQSYIIMKYFYVRNGDYVNGTYKWFVVNTAGTGTSVANFLGNLDGFFGNETEGLFGIKKGTTSGDFSLALIIFIITLFMAGVMTYKYGITAITATMFLITSILLFFDVGAGLLPEVANVPHAITIIFAIITAIFFIKEVYQ